MSNCWLVVPTFLAILTGLPLQALAISGMDRAASKNLSTPDEAADKGIAMLRELKNDARAQELGFMSAKEAHDAQRGVPLRVFRIKLDALQNFHPGDDPQQLLFETHSMLYPLRVHCSTGSLPCRDGEVRSSLTVHELQKSPGGWRTIMRGAAKLIVELEKFRTSDSNFAVWVPALNVFMLGDQTGGQFTMTPIETKHGMNAGQAVSVSDAIARFVHLTGDLDDEEEDQDDEGGAT